MAQVVNIDAVDLKNRRVLVVDDEPFARSLTVRLLKEMGNPTIEVASTGFEAIEALMGYGPPFDFALVDFNMPKMTGLDLLKEIRTGKGSRRRELPVAMLTGHSSRDLVGLAMALDVNAFLVKPTSRAALASRIARMLDEEPHIQDVAHYAAIELPAATLTKDVEKRDSVSILAPPREVDKPHAPAPHKVTVHESRNFGHDSEPAMHRYGPRVRRAIADLEEGSLLASDLLSSHGICLLRAGVVLNKRLLSRLNDLAEAHEIDHVWVSLAA